MKKLTCRETGGSDIGRKAALICAMQCREACRGTDVIMDLRYEIWRY